MKKHLTSGIVLTLACAGLGACATGRYPVMPTSAEYDRSCEDLFAEYRGYDERTQNRKFLAYSVDSAIALTAIGITVATSGAAGPGVPIGAIVLSQAKGDLGHESVASRRETTKQMAIRKGCTNDDVEAALAAEMDPPAASGDASDK